MAVAGDVSRADDVAAIVDACIRSFGRIDVLHNNVGIVEVGGPVETSEESWDRVNDVNLKSMFLTCKHVLPHMERQGKGAIVNIASVSGIRWLGVPYISYAATKAAVIQFTRVIALQYARSGIRANSILPGMMNTPMVHAAEVIAAYGGSGEEMVVGATSRVRWGGWVMPVMSHTRLCFSHPTRPNTLPVAERVAAIAESVGGLRRETPTGGVDFTAGINKLPRALRRKEALGACPSNRFFWGERQYLVVYRHEYAQYIVPIARNWHYSDRLLAPR
jgi:NAD(P)-dependent dehydrogenase (short-subunit alcohol dehydrogenase family)